MASHNAPPSAGSVLDPLFTGLFAAPPVPLPFLEGVDLRSYVLKTDLGTVIIYNTPGIDAAAAEIQQIGSPARLFINHYHEGMYGQPDLDVAVYVHERDRAGIAPSMKVAGVFTQREKLGADLEVIPSFSHTAGTTFFLWDSGEHRFLFTGDAIWVEGGVWKAVILGESNRRAFLDTLSLLRELEFDVLVPWLAPRGEPPYARVTPEQKHEQIERLIARIDEGAAGPRV